MRGSTSICYNRVNSKLLLTGYAYPRRQDRKPVLVICRTDSA